MLSRSFWKALLVVKHDEKKFLHKQAEQVMPSERIGWTNDEGEEGVITTVTFEDHGGRTLLNFHEVYPSKEPLEEALQGSAAALPGQFGADPRIAFQHRRVARVREIRLVGMSALGN